MRRFLICLLLTCAAGPVAADVKPLEAAIGEMSEGIACASDPTQTYTLYVPTAYTKERRFPVLLVFDPRGRSLLAAELFREAAETYGWIIVSSDNTRSDGPMEPNIIALQALWPEIHTRLPIDFDRIYAAGFSGGAAVAYALSRVTRGLAGIIACGGRYFPSEFEGNDVAVFATAGDLDFNYEQTQLVDEHLGKQGNPHRLVIFEGPHTWMPPVVAREAVEWLEVIAMQRGQRETDSDLVISLFAADMATAEALAAGGREIEALRRFREIDEAFAGLVDTETAVARAAEVEVTAAYRSQAKEVKKSRAFESHCVEDVARGLANLRTSEIAPPVERLERDLRIEELLKRSGAPDAMGRAAQRCLNSLYVNLSFYLPRDTAAERRYAHAATSYELAVLIHGDNPIVWYNLACMRARLGHHEAAMNALERALEMGFDRTDLLASDQDLDSLRDRDDFKQLLAAASG